MAWAAIIGAILGVGSEVVGTVFSRLDYDKQKAVLDKVADMYGGIIPPQVKQEMAEQLGPSAYEHLAPDKENIARQVNAYNALEQEYSQPGGSDISRAADMRAENEAGGIAGSLDASNLARMRRRGLGGSGLESIMSQAAGQAGVNRAAEMESQAAAEAQRRRMQAIEAAGNMAGGMRAQGWKEGSERAQAIDALNKANAGLRWDAKKYNNNLQQQAFDNAMQLAQGKGNALMGQANYYGGAAGRDAQTGNDYAGLLIQGGAGISKMMKNDDDEEKKKQNSNSGSSI